MSKGPSALARSAAMASRRCGGERSGRALFRVLGEEIEQQGGQLSGTSRISKMSGGGSSMIRRAMAAASSPT